MPAFAPGQALVSALRSLTLVLVFCTGCALSRGHGCTAIAFGQARAACGSSAEGALVLETTADGGPVSANGVSWTHVVLAGVAAILTVVLA